jgi:hypothetical protein
MKMIRSGLIASFSIAALLTVGMVTAGPARAQSDDPRTACTPDAFRLCSEYIPDANRITACLIQKRASLSPACRVFFTRSRATAATASRKTY